VNPVSSHPSRRLLTQTELTDRVQQLPIAKRTAYNTLLTVVNVSVFVLCTAFTLLLIVLLFPLIGEVFEQTDELLLAGLLAITALMVCAGYSGSPIPDHTLPDETLADNVRRAILSGLRNGAAFGFGFGIVWGLIVNLNIIYVEINTLVETSFSVFDILKYGFVFALAVTVPYMLMRATQAVTSTLLLRRFESA